MTELSCQQAGSPCTKAGWDSTSFTLHVTAATLSV